MSIIRGYSRKGRKLSAAVFIPLSVLFVVLSVVYGEPRDAFGPALMLGLSLLLLTPIGCSVVTVGCVGSQKDIERAAR